MRPPQSYYHRVVKTSTMELTPPCTLSPPGVVDLKAEFVLSANKPEHFPTDGLPEVAFLGRSNVGKSSLINAITGITGLAFTSNTPGRTQSINFYRIDDSFYFVDLPGYGYAEVPLASKQEWAKPSVAPAWIRWRFSLMAGSCGRWPCGWRRKRRRRRSIQRNWHRPAPG